MALSTLPPELIHHLLSRLDRQDASRLSRTCKRIRSIALPCVYKILQWTLNDQEVHCLDAISPRIPLLLRSLMGNPQLGDYVKHVQLQPEADGWPPSTRDSLWAPDCPPQLSPSEIDSAMQWVEHFDLASPREIHSALQRMQPFYVASPDHWNDALRRGNVHTYLALTLAFFPKLCSLFLRSSTDCPTNSRFIGSLLTHAVGPDAKAPPLAKLPSYELLWDVRLEMFSDSPVALMDIYSFFYLPSLTTITVELGSARQFQWPSPPQKRPALRSLTSLQLPYCEATEDALERILSFKPPLKRLLYKYSAAVEAEGEFFNLSTLSRALNHVRATLESLTLGIEFQTDTDRVPDYSDGPFTGTLASFHDFPRLTYLEIPFVMLTGWRHIPRHARMFSSLLPPSLRYLCLTDDLISWENCNLERPEEWLDRLQDLLAERQAVQGGEPSGLEKVRLKFQAGGRNWKDEHKAEFKSLCMRYGVKGVV